MDEADYHLPGDPCNPECMLNGKNMAGEECDPYDVWGYNEETADDAAGNEAILMAH